MLLANKFLEYMQCKETTYDAAESSGMPIWLTADVHARWPIAQVPDTIGDLVTLKTLNLGNNSLEVRPKAALSSPVHPPESAPLLPTSNRTAPRGG